MAPSKFKFHIAMMTLTMKSVDIDDYDVKFTMSVVRFLILLQPKISSTLKLAVGFLATF